MRDLLGELARHQYEARSAEDFLVEIAADMLQNPLSTNRNIDLIATPFMEDPMRLGESVQVEPGNEGGIGYGLQVHVPPGCVTFKLYHH